MQDRGRGRGHQQKALHGQVSFEQQQSAVQSWLSIEKMLLQHYGKQIQ